MPIGVVWLGIALPYCVPFPGDMVGENRHEYRGGRNR
jgi:hypothetical protein